MEVHANAPLGPKGRGIMVRRVVDQGWSLNTAAAAAATSALSTRSTSDPPTPAPRHSKAPTLAQGLKHGVRLGLGREH